MIAEFTGLDEKTGEDEVSFVRLDCIVAAVGDTLFLSSGHTITVREWGSLIDKWEEYHNG